MHLAVINRRTRSARILFTGAAAARAVGTATITTVARGVGGPGKATTVALAPCGVSFQNGSIYVADGDTVRNISPAGQLTTPAGTGVAGPRSTGGLATKTALVTCGTAVDHAGNLVMADPGRHQVTVVAAKTGNFYGQAMTTGDIYTVAGNGGYGFSGDGGPATHAALAAPEGVAVDGQGNLLISDSARIRLVTG
jgi:trimeric autotransporter adhesin